MKRRTLFLELVVGLAFVGCSSSQSSGFGDAAASGNPPITKPTGDGSTPPVIIGGGDTGTTALQGGDGGGGTTEPDSSTSCNYASTDTVDHDGDGWSNAEGDCNDCNKYINPGAYDIPANNVDEDCDGKVDDEPTGCDSALSGVATSVGSDGAKAMDLCRTTLAGAPLPTRTWGVISADYVLPDGTSTPTEAPESYVSNYECTFDPSNFNLGFGILGPTYGASNAVQEGQHALGLSSGTARQPTDPGYQDVGGFDKCSTSGAPTGFPGQTPACGNVTFGKPHDGSALRVVIRVPTNALTMAFDSNFFSYEFPDYVCSTYNDTYVVIMTPTPEGEPTTANDNIAFDSNNNIISVNAGFLTVCQPGAHEGYACAEGPSKLAGTGFAGHASTDWLTTTVSVASLAGQDITLLYAIWDSSDGELDSTVLIDNVHWTFATSPNTATPPPTTPVTVPK